MNPRPYTFAQGADNDAIGASQPLFQRPVNPDATDASIATANKPVRDRGCEQLRVILKGYRERPDLLGDFLKCRSQCRAIRARRRASGLVDARPPERFPMAHRKAGEILTGGRGGGGFKRLERGGDASKQSLGLVKFPGMK